MTPRDSRVQHEWEAEIISWKSKLKVKPTQAPTLYDTHARTHPHTHTTIMILKDKATVVCLMPRQGPEHRLFLWFCSRQVICKLSMMATSNMLYSFMSLILFNPFFSFFFFLSFPPSPWFSAFSSWALCVWVRACVCAFSPWASVRECVLLGIKVEVLVDGYHPPPPRSLHAVYHVFSESLPWSL